MRSKAAGKIEPGILKSVDFFLLMVILVLTAFGLIMVFSASYYYSISLSTTDSPFTYLIRDSIWVAMGLAAMALGAMVDYHFYCKRIFAIAIVAVCFALLFVVFTPMGQTVNGASRWIALGPVTIMPGEIAKLGLIFFTAWFYGSAPERARLPLRGLAPVFLIMAAFAVMIIKEPNLSTAITVCGIVVAMQLVAGMRVRYVALLGILAGGALGALLTLAPERYWLIRLTSFLDPFADAAGDGYQAAQSLLALGSGGLFGCGLGKSVQKSLYLPEPQNDFILAIIGEELGFIGILALLAVYCLFIWRGAKIAIQAPDQFGLLLASGIVLMVAIQVILNVAVITSSMPPTGINLPFISYGGNSLLMFMFSSGLLLNISRHSRGNEIIIHSQTGDRR